MSERGRFPKSPIAQAAHSLFCELGPNPQKNIHLIVTRAADFLNCSCAAYGCLQNEAGDLRFRAAHNLPARPSMVRERARRICGEIISGNEAKVLCEPDPSEQAKAGFKTFLGHPVAVNGRNTGALLTLHAQGRKFDEQDRRMIALLANMLAIEDSRLQREEALSRRISLETMLKDLSTKAIAVEDLSAFIEHALAIIGTRMAVGGSFLWEYDSRKKTLNNTYEWLAEGRTPRKSKLQNIPANSMPWSVGRLLKSDILRIDDVRSIPDKRERRLFEKLKVRAFLVIPLFSRDRFYGFVGLECYRGPKSWAAEDARILQTAAEIMMRCIENRQLTRELVASQKNLEKTVGKKTLALRRANMRLTAEIAAHKKSIAALKRREADLAERNKAFLQLSNALASMLNKPTAALDESDECLIMKLDEMIDSERERLAPAEQEQYLGRMRKGLKELRSLLKTKSTFVYQCLTPMEIQVAKLVMQDRGNKEIASLLNLSRRTVEVHRYNIRKKLQLDKSRRNLKTYLLSME